MSDDLPIDIRSLSPAELRAEALRRRALTRKPVIKAQKNDRRSRAARDEQIVEKPLGSRSIPFYAARKPRQGG